MPINKFKIVKSPLKASILIDTIEHVLNQEYSIAKQGDTDIVVTGVGVPYDSFIYRLGSDDGNWSPELEAIINVNVDAGTPVSGAVAEDIAGNATTDITSAVVFDQYTDRFTILEPVAETEKYGILKINDIDVVLGQVYFISDVVTIKFLSTHNAALPNEATSYRIQTANYLVLGNIATFVLTSTANLQGESNGLTTSIG